MPPSFSRTAAFAELEVIDSEDERPLTPFFIRFGKTGPGPIDWFRLSKPDDLLVRDGTPSGDITVTATIRTPERAAPARQLQAAWYFAEVLTQGIDDVLDQELWPKSSTEKRSGDVQTRASAARLDPPTTFGIEVKVWLFVDDEVALDLLAKLYLLLDSKHARYPELWQDLFASRGVRDATPSSFRIFGRVAGRDLDPATIPVRYYPPRDDGGPPAPYARYADPLA